MCAATRAKVEAFFDRYSAIDWRLPSRDAAGVVAAYQAWQAPLGMAWPIRLITDPLDAPIGMGGDSPDWFGEGGEATGGVWPFPAGDPVLRMMWPTLLPPLAPEWDIAVAWAYAFIVSRSLDGMQSRARVMADLAPLLAAVSRIAAVDAANLKAMALLYTPFLGLLDPPSRVVSIVRDLLAVSDNDLAWQHLAHRDQEYAKAFNIDTTGLETQPRRHEVIDALIALWEPMLAACERGAFAHVLRDGELIVLASPPIWTDGRRLHRLDGPAITWRETRVYAWKGCVVPERFIVQRAATRPDDIRVVPDERVRRTLVDLYAYTHGHQRCMQDFGGVMMHEDATGRLWCVNPDRRLPAAQPGDMKLVEVVNGTPEGDGSRKTYWLNVPPDMQSAQQAVAWTYGMTPEQYSVLVVRT